MFILTDLNNVVVCISPDMEQNSKGQYVDYYRDTIYLNSDELMLHEVEDNTEITTHRYCYTPEQEFFKNIDYKDEVTEDNR